MHPRCSLAASALALLASFPVVAADKETDTIVVTATRFNEADPKVAANISIITRQDILNTPAQNLPDVLSTRAGIVVSSLYGAMGRDATVDMRGFGSTATNNTLILIDGQRVNPVDSGSIIWSAIPLESVERIEIIRGSGTVLYGDGATGGVINIITNKSGRRVASVAATVGSYDYKGSDIHLSNGNDKVYYNLFINTAAADGYRKNNQQDQQRASGRAGLLLDRGEVFTDFSVYKESQGLPGYLLSEAFNNDPRSTRTPYDSQKRDGYRIRPGISYQINDKITFEAETGLEHQNLKSNYVSFSSSSDRDRDTLSLTPRFRWRHGLGSLTSETVVGADFYNGEVSAKYNASPNQGASQKSSAFYLQNSTGITSNLSLTAGAREQRVKQSARQDADAFNPSMAGESTRSQSAFELGLAYAVDGWRVYGKTGTTFRFANLDELFGYNLLTFAPVFAGNLNPQHGRINEVGGNVAVGSAKFRASFYQLDLTDEIGYDGAVGANANFSPTRRKGGEFEADWKISASVLTKASYAYTDASFRSGAYSGNSVPLVPRNQASAQVTWNTGSTGSYSAIERYVGERRFDSDFANTQGMLSSYTKLDLQGVWDLKPWKITAKILNVLDKKYSPFSGYSAGKADTYYYPADARSFFVSGRYDF